MEKNKQTAEQESQSFQAFRALFLGPSGIGKSYTAFKWVLRMIKADQFEPQRVVVISKTWKSDSSQEKLISYCEKQYKGFKKNNCFEDIDLDFLRQLFISQKNIKDNNKKTLKSWLLLFDDQISNGLLKQQKDPIMKDLFCVGRHYNISQVWMLQRFKNNLDPSCRDMFTIICIFRLAGMKAIKEFLEDYDQGLGENHKESMQNMIKIYNDATTAEKGHGCLTIHCLRLYGQQRLQKGFTDEYYDV